MNVESLSAINGMRTHGIGRRSISLPGGVVQTQADGLDGLTDFMNNR